MDTYARMALGMALGTGASAPAGLALGRAPVWIAFGIALGAAAAFLLGRRR